MQSKIKIDIWEQCAARKAMRRNVFMKRKKLRQKHANEKAKMLRMVQKTLAVMEREAIMPRVNHINALDIPIEEKRRRIAEVIAQEKG